MKPIEKYAFMQEDELYAMLKTSAEGLKSSDIKKHASHLDNGGPYFALGWCLYRSFVNPFAIALLVMAIILLAKDFLIQADFTQNYPVLIIFSMFFAGGSLRLYQELKTRKTLRHLNKITKETAMVKRDSVWQKIASAELCTGDIVKIRKGDRLKADIRILAAFDLYISQSAITGESKIIKKTAQPEEQRRERISDYGNIALKESVVINGRGIGVVLDIADRDPVINNDRKMKDSFDKEAQMAIRILLRFAAVLLPSVLMVLFISQQELLTSGLFVLSIGVGLIPELLPMVVAACLSRGAERLSRQGVIVKDINAMHALGNIDTLCVDKTGTLTNDEISLEYYLDILGRDSERTLQYALLNSFFSVDRNYLDEALLKVLNLADKSEQYQKIFNSFQPVFQTSYDPFRRYARVDLNDRSNYLSIIKGQTTAILECCRYAEYRGERISLHIKDAMALHDELARDGMKVTAVAYKDKISDREDDYVLLGYVAFFDTVKKEAAQAIASLQELNVRVVIMSGDEVEVTKTVARKLGLKDGKTLVLNQEDNKDLALTIEEIQVMAEMLPDEKADMIKLLQDNGHKVAYLGDGLNDLAGARRADVAIAVENAAPVMRQSADIILLNRDLRLMIQGIIEGRRSFANMTKYIKITASSNFGNILAVAVSALFLPFLPMTGLQLLLLNLLYDALCLIMPWDNVDNSVLKEPVSWSGRSLSRFICWFGPLSTVFDLLTFIFLFKIVCPWVITKYHFDPAQFLPIFQTGWFLESMWTQIMILYFLRTAAVPFVQSRPSLPFLIVTLVGITLYTILTITPLGRLFGLVIMPGWYYIYLFGNMILYGLLVSWAKRVYCRKEGRLL